VPEKWLGSGTAVKCVHFQVLWKLKEANKRMEKMTFRSVSFEWLSILSLSAYPESEDHVALCTADCIDFFLGAKAVVAGSWPDPCSSCRSQECIKLYLHFFLHHDVGVKYNDKVRMVNWAE